MNRKAKNAAVLAGILPLLMMGGGHGNLYGNRSIRPKPRKSKPKYCLHCGGEHNHNNSWCSASCCNSWRAAKKENK